MDMTMKRIVCTLAMGLLGLLGQLPLASRALAAASPIGMPATTGCQSTPPPAPIASGTDPGVPGHWWNPKWYGTGWDFFFTSDPNQIVLYWLTYNANHQPVWLFNGGNAPAFGIGDRDTGWIRIHPVLERLEHCRRTALAMGCGWVWRHTARRVRI
jgi:hypothetical protein